MSIPGADVSSVQGAISPGGWATFKAEGREWAYDKCIGGVTGGDPTWAANAAGCRAAGVVFGAYCVFVPGDPAEAQAHAWFTASGACGTHPGELPPAIDFEEASKTISEVEEIIALCLVIREMTEFWGRAPVLYTYPDFWRRVVANAAPDELATIAACPLWFASYESTAPLPPHPWTAVTFWQRSGGTNGFRAPNGAPCDDDVFLGSAEELAALASFGGGLPNANANPLAGIPVPGLDIPGENT
jgi:lysozyme